MDANELKLRRLQANAYLNLARAMRRIEQRMARMFIERGLDDVTPAQANALMILFQAKEPITARQLSQLMSLSEVTVGRFVKALEKSGWLTRVRDENDRRAVLLHLEDKAYDTLPLFIDVNNELGDHVFEGLSERRMEQLIRDIGRVRENVESDKSDDAR